MRVHRWVLVVVFTGVLLSGCGDAANEGRSTGSGGEAGQEDSGDEIDPPEGDGGVRRGRLVDECVEVYNDLSADGCGERVDVVLAAQDNLTAVREDPFGPKRLAAQEYCLFRQINEGNEGIAVLEEIAATPAGTGLSEYGAQVVEGCLLAVGPEEAEEIFGQQLDEEASSCVVSEYADSSGRLTAALEADIASPEAYRDGVTNFDWCVQ